MNEEKTIQVKIPTSYLILIIKIAVFLVAVILVIKIGSSFRQGSVIAVVNGEKISKRELHTRLENMYGKEILDRLIEEKLVIQEGKKQKIEVKESEVTKKVDELIGRFPSKERFEELLKESNMTIKDVREQIKIGLVLDKLVSKTIPEQEVKDFFEQNRDRFNKGEQVKARHILLKSEGEAKEVLMRIKKGEDFASLAKEKSADVGTKDKGGNLGYFPRGRMDPEFERVSFSLQVGEVSDIVKTDYGYHIIKVEDKVSAKIATYQEAKEEARNILVGQRTNNFIEELKNKSKIVNYLKKEKKEEKKEKKEGEEE